MRPVEEPWWSCFQLAWESFQRRSLGIGAVLVDAGETVVTVGGDPMWYGVERIPELNHNMARRWTRRVGPVDGPLQIWGGVLPLIDALERDIRSVVQCYAEAKPDILRLARTLAPTADSLRAMTLSAALDAVGPDLARP